MNPVELVVSILSLYLFENSKPLLFKSVLIKLRSLNFLLISSVVYLFLSTAKYFNVIFLSGFFLRQDNNSIKSSLYISVSSITLGRG